MNLLRIVLRHGMLAAALLAASGQFALAQEAYPVRSIRLLVGFAAGGATDVTFRKLGELASKQLGQPIIIENKPGAGATLAPSTMAKNEQPDGYTIAAATAGLLRYPYMQKVDWDPIKDFTWIVGLGGYSFALAVNAESPLKNLGDLITYAKENPGKVTIATAGAGTTMAATLQSTENKPAFIAPIYGAQRSVDVPADAPPMFVALASDDPLFGNNEYGLITAWKKAGRPVEFHLYQNGGHGFGLGNPGKTSTGWFPQFMLWLESNGMLKRN